jgi:Zn-dependent protease
MLRSVGTFSPLRGQVLSSWSLQTSAVTLSKPCRTLAGRHLAKRETTSPLIRYQSSLMSKRPNPLVRSPPFDSYRSPLYLHLGSVSYFSSYFGGGGRRPGGGNRWMQGAGFLSAGALFLGKTKYIIGALKLTKLASLGSMVFTIGTYSMFFGVPYAVGMVGLIGVHEVGHALVMHQRGIKFSPMVFMPFMGAMIQMKNRPRNAWEDSLVAFGGPALGSLGAAGVAVAAHMTESQLLFALADFGFMVNLFNMMPLGSMDGGRIAGALSPWSHVVGLGMGGTLAFSGAIHNPIFFLILLGGGYETYQRFFNPGAIPPGFYAITPIQRAAIGLGYVGLVGGLALAMDVNERYKKPPEVLIRERDMMEKSWVMH